MGLTSVVTVRPSILVLSRPADRLSPVTTDRFLRYISHVGRRLKAAIVVARRELSRILPLSSEILIVRGGKVSTFSSPRGIKGVLGRGSDGAFLSVPTPVRV